jgi:hypothetical protein
MPADADLSTAPAFGKKIFEPDDRGDCQYVDERHDQCRIGVYPDTATDPDATNEQMYYM